ARRRAARRRDGGLGDRRQPRPGARREVRLHGPCARARRHRGALSERPRARGPDHAGVQPPGGGASLAAGLEPLGTVEVGFHVPGPASGEGRRGSRRAAGDSVERSKVITHPSSLSGSRSFLLFLCSFLCVLVTSAAAQIRRPRADVTPLIEKAAHPGETARVALKVSLPEGLHTQSNKPRDENLIPTELSITAPPGVTVKEIVWPAPTDLNQVGADKPLAVFEQTFAIGVQLTVDASVPPGDLIVPAGLRYQACDANLCYPPASAVVQWTIPVVAAGTSVTTAADPLFATITFGTGETPAASAVAPAPLVRGGTSPANDASRLDAFNVLGTTGGYQGTSDFLKFIHDAETGVTQRGLFEGRGPLMILLIVLVGGLALNLTPCVLPMIPINLAIIGAGAQASSRARGFLLGSAYGGAMAVVYAVLGLIVILTAGTFGTINSSPWFNLGIAILFVVLGLAMFDVLLIDFSKYSNSVGTGSGRGTFALAFTMGAVAALLAGACVAPVVIQVVLFSSNLYA